MEIFLGERLKELRCDRGLTQKQLAVELGINKVTYSRYESSLREPSISTLIKIANYYGVTVDYILGLKEY